MNRLAISLVIILLVSCGRSSQESEYISMLPHQTLEITEFEMVEFAHIPFAGIIDQWKIGPNGFTLLSNSSLYHYANPDREPSILNSDLFLELQGCVISDFSIDGSKLYVLCEGKGRALRFDLDQMIYETTFDLGIDASTIEVFDERVFLYQTPNTLNRDSILNFQILTYPVSRPEKLDKYLWYPASETNSFAFNVLTNEPIASSEKEVIFTRMLNDTLIIFSSDGGLTRIELLNAQPQGVESQPELGLEQEQLYFPLYLFQAEDWRWYSVVKNGALLTLVQHLPSGKKTLVDKLKLSNGVQLPFLGQMFENEIYLLLTEEAFIEFNPNKSYPEPFERLRNYEMPFVFLRIPLSELAE